MTRLTIASPAASSGKTAVAVGLARVLGSRGASVSLARTGADENAAHDGRVFEAFGGTAESAAIALTEVPAGSLAEADATDDSRVLVVVTPAFPADRLAQELKSVSRVAGVVVNHDEEQRAAYLRSVYENAGVRVIGLIVEDPFLASPSIGVACDVLQADARNLDASRDIPLGLPAIASIAADPGQTYFSRLRAESIIVRSDKPDLQLAALNAGVRCLIVTGESPLLSYVVSRVDEDEIPLLRTTLDTQGAVAALEGLFGAMPFNGEQKARRMAELMSGMDIEGLLTPAASAVS
jgi:hypothetical protein